MNTLQFINAVSKKCNKYKSHNEILALTNDSQNELLGMDCDILRTKPDPFLVTTDGVFEYSLPVGVRNVGRVYMRNMSTSGYDHDRQLYFDCEYDLLGNVIIPVPVYIEPATSPDSQAKIIFDSEYNPADNTTLYRYERFDWPEQLTSTSIDLTIPTQFVTKALMASVMAKIDEERFGRGGYWEAKLDAYESQLKDFIYRTRTIEDTSIRPF